jgi:lipopolysaccharide/colanic/teichoic acid biosynthesis glycosyltransferase
MAAGGTGVRLVGCLHDFRPVGARLLDGIRVVGDPTHLEECVRRYAVDEVVVAPTAVTWESLQRVLELASRHEWPRVRLLPGLYDALTTGVKVTYEHRVPMMALEPLRIRGPEAAVKHVMDYAVALCFLPLVLAVIGVAWVASLFDGAGSPLTTTTVQGRGGRPFGLLFLRRPAYERGHGPWRGRIAGSRLGKLPAFLNVLRGDLSLVGPRAVPLASEPSPRIPLSCVKPGLTGPWRFPGEDGNGRGLPPEVEYVQGYSLWLDLRLLLGSLRRLLLRREAVPLLGRAGAGPKETTARMSTPRLVKVATGARQERPAP